MAKTAMPMILAAGAAAVLLAGRKKKKVTEKEVVEEEERWTWTPTDVMGGEAEMLVLDDECNEIAEKISYDKHNQWITTQYEKLVSEGTVDPAVITLQLLRQQSTHCPWDDRDSWTPLMTALHDQLHAAVLEYGRRRGHTGG